MNDIASPVTDGPSAPGWLAGIWQRQEILLPDGTADRTTRVFWGQTHTLFVDIRIPADRPSGEGRTSFADYSVAELRQLAEQKGFAGHVAVEGNVCRWIRYTDYRPNNGRPDVGRLRLDGDTLYEEGDPTSVLGSAYRETYARVGRADRRSVALQRIGSTGQERSGLKSDDGVLVIIGERFFCARSRAIQLPPAETLKDLVVAAADDRALIHAYLDCEVSYGRIDDQIPWQVELSTIPFREQSRLCGLGTVRAAANPDCIVLSGQDENETWQIVESSVRREELIAMMNQ
jgi:hypothetical protein